jgi:hypothetical protein
LKILIILTVAMLSACSWFHSKAPHGIEPGQFVVTGAPKDSILFMDDVQQGQAAESNGKPRYVDAVEGQHKLEIRFGDTVVYRENIYIKNGERRVVIVLSGSSRE